MEQRCWQLDQTSCSSVPHQKLQCLFEIFVLLLSGCSLLKKVNMFFWLLASSNEYYAITTRGDRLKRRFLDVRSSREGICTSLIQEKRKMEVCEELLANSTCLGPAKAGKDGDWPLELFAMGTP